MASFPFSARAPELFSAHGACRLVAVCLAWCASVAGQAGPEVISIGNGGQLAASSSHSAVVSGNGRVVAFMSNAENLYAHDGNSLPDVFVRDLDAQALTCVSIARNGNTGEAGSDRPALSADGRFVAFESAAANLVLGDTNGFADIFVVDLVTGIIERVSVSSIGRESDLPCVLASLSGDGRFVAFESYATSLVAGSDPGVSEIFVRDRARGQTFIASTGLNGENSNGSSTAASFSIDGSRVAFQSWGSNLVPDDFNNSIDVFVYDLPTGELMLASQTFLGGGVAGHSGRPSLSADGRLVAFHSGALNIVAGGSNFYSDCFVRDLETGEVQRVSVSTSGVEGNNHSGRAGITGNGRLVVFHSYASNLVADDTNVQQDVFVHDRITGQTLRLSTNAEGVQGGALSLQPSIAVWSGHVVFESWAENLVPGDVNQQGDVFIRHAAGALKSSGH